jgi:hypothetical protein
VSGAAPQPIGFEQAMEMQLAQYTSPTRDSDAALAVPCFSNSYRHGDWCNAPGSVCGFGEMPWNPGDSYNESLVVRGAVPELATWAMLVPGFGLVRRGIRRR